MPFVSPPPLPPFVAAELPFDRRAYRLESEPDAGRLLHLIDHRETAGRDAPAVLLVHGNPAWSFLWRKVIRRLPEMRCVAPDLLGLGLSDKPRKLSWHTVDRHADAVAELVEALDLRDFVLVGQDWGGPIAAGVGARHPDRVRGLVFGNTSVLAPANPRGTAFHRFARLPLVSDFVFRVLGFPQRDLSKAQGDRSSIQGDVSRAYRWPLRHFRDRAAPLAMARMVPDSANHPSMDALRRGEAFVTAFEGPVELVWGTKDPILGRALGKHEKALPQARVTRTEAGHFLQEEVPDELAAAVRRVAAS